MAITDINISEELETGIPSIKYRGNEGPKSPKEEMKMAGPDRYFKILEFMLNELEGELGRELTNEEYEEVGRRAMEEFDQSRGPVIPEDPTKPINPFGPKPQGPILPDRMMAGTDTPDIEIEMLQELLEAFREKFNRDPVSIDELKRATDQMRTKAAYGGIMGLDGRRRYGLGSKLKKLFRKVVPNELSSIAVKAAPFIAPFNPLAAGLMSGLGSFDQTGRIGSSLKSGLMNYGLGQASRYLGGGADNLQKGFGLKINPGGKGLGKYFSSPYVSGKDILSRTFEKPTQEITFDSTVSDRLNKDAGLMEVPAEGVESLVDVSQAKNIDKLSPIGELATKIKDYAMDNKLATVLLAKQGFDLLGSPDQVVDEIMGRGEGLDISSIRAEVQEAFADSSGNKLKALRVKYPYLGEASTKLAEGGRIGFENAGPVVDKQTQAMILDMNSRGMDIDTISTMTQQNADTVRAILGAQNQINTTTAQGMAEGGIMDLGGMEKDYRAEGGFVPIGKEEKADDVPARLSVNEFVFTADAVRNAGGGDIDKGAEIMENMMKHLEQGGQVSEESQGMQGAQQMFETSERLSEVI